MGCAVLVYAETSGGIAGDRTRPRYRALDTKLNLHLFSRLLRLPLDYFERHPAGETMYQVAQVYRVREFLTGQLLATFLDLLTLAVLLPFLFWLNAPLAWVVLLCAGLISIIILAYLKPMREMYSRVVGAAVCFSAFRPKLNSAVI